VPKGGEILFTKIEFKGGEAQRRRNKKETDQLKF
jgi:hypothetical protein